VDQVFVKDPDGKIKVGDLIIERISKLGENIQIRRFARFQLGEKSA
jgi:elongation factor Ts